MNARAFVEDLQNRGATLEVDGERMRVTPAGALTDADRATWKQHRMAILQVLAQQKNNTPPTTTIARNRPASTCSLNRVVLRLPTPDEFARITPDTFARAELLRRRLVAAGVVLKTSCDAGALHFDEPRLLIEFERIARDDWLELLGCIAEMQKILESQAEYSTTNNRAHSTAHKVR